MSAQQSIADVVVIAVASSVVSARPEETGAVGEREEVVHMRPSDDELMRCIQI